MRVTKHQVWSSFGSSLIAAICFTQFACSRQTTQAPVSPSSSPAVAQNTAPTNQAPTTSISPGEAAKPSGEASPKPAEATAAAPRTFTLPAGRSLAIWTSSTLSTKTNKSGERFTASLAQPIVDGDWVIAKKGAAVEGVIVNSDPGGRVKGVASLAIALKRLTLADGRTVELSTSSFVQRAKTTKKKDAMKIGLSAGIGAAIGALAGGGKGAAIGAGVGGGAGTGVVLATRGDPATIPSETRMSFRLAAPINVTKQ